MIEEVRFLYERRSISDRKDGSWEDTIILTTEQKEAIRNAGSAIVCTQTELSDTIVVNE